MFNIGSCPSSLAVSSRKAFIVQLIASSASSISFIFPLAVFSSISKTSFNSIFLSNIVGIIAIFIFEKLCESFFLKALNPVFIFFALLPFTGSTLAFSRSFIVAGKSFTEQKARSASAPTPMLFVRMS